MTGAFEFDGLTVNKIGCYCIDKLQSAKSLELKQDIASLGQLLLCIFLLLKTINFSISYNSLF